MEKKERLTVVSLKVTHSFKKLIEDFIALDTHVTKSGFVRDAIREKIMRDAPGLYARLFSGI